MTSVNDERVVAEVSAFVDRYETALADNDLASMSTLFWESGATIRFDPTGEQHGHAAIDAWRSTRRPPGPRDVIRTQVTTFDDTCAIATVEFTRAGSTDVGRQMQTWVRIEDVGWRVVAAHVSTRPSPS